MSDHVYLRRQQSLSSGCAIRAGSTNQTTMSRRNGEGSFLCNEAKQYFFKTAYPKAP
jgi:hypothetical protein